MDQLLLFLHTASDSLVLLSTGLDTGMQLCMHIPRQLLLLRSRLSDGSLATYSVTKDKIDW